ncbi:MAG: coil containing protein [Caudoviricetes sp.]|nr:MAG: coil containing protein [Caudoviricetes sp.]
MSTVRKIPLWEVQKKIDERDFNYYGSLSVDEQKQISMYPLMRMIYDVKGVLNLELYYIHMVNQVVNEDFWKLSKHPELQWKLLASCGIGVKQKHGWIAQGKKKSNTPKLDELLFSINPLMNDEELSIVKSKLTKEKITEITRGRGFSDKDGKLYQEEFKKFSK